MDFYGDEDLRAAAPGVSLGRDLRVGWSPARAVRAAAAASAPAVAYAMDFENAPAAVAALARGRELLGNRPATLRAVRDPERLFAALTAAGLPTPAILPFGARTPRGGRRLWLRKPRAGGGGRGVAFARAGSGSRHGEILQEHVAGPVLGLSFLADGRRCRPLALALQIDDRRAFGAERFGYCGSLSWLPAGALAEGVREQAARAAGAATEAFGLRGLNGMDFVLHGGEVFPLEVNPRHTSSMELRDDAATRLFAAHVGACRGDVGALEGGWLAPLRGVRGKAVLFARRDVRVREAVREPGGFGAAALAGEAAAGWRSRALADVPHPGERIRRGHPVCSLFAVAADAETCLERLRCLARSVEEDLLTPDSALEGPRGRAGRRPLAGAPSGDGARQGST